MKTERKTCNENNDQNIWISFFIKYKRKREKDGKVGWNNNGNEEAM